MIITKKTINKIKKKLIYTFYLLKYKKYFNNYKNCYKYCSSITNNSYEDNYLNNYRLKKFLYNKNNIPYIYKPSYKFLLEAILMFMSKNNKIPKIIDFGGGFGDAALYLRKLLNFNNYSYCVVETENLCRMAKLIKEKYIYFFSNLDLAIKNFSPDIIYTNQAIQYLEEPYEIIQKFKKSSVKLIVMTGNSFSKNNEIFSQPSLLSDNGAGEHVKSYKDKLIIYPQTKIDKEKIKNYLKKKYSLIIDDVSGDLIFAIK